VEVKLVHRSGVAIARMSGKLAAGSGDRQLHDLIDDLLAQNKKRILLDLSEVTGIDSSGVGELVAGLRVARELGGELKILKVEGNVHRILQLTQALPLFDVYDDEATAIAAFARVGADGASRETSG
jgi:anti-sigma B factor antagonist